jgi:hypothetical protein
VVRRTSSPNYYKWSKDKKFDTTDRSTQNDKQILPDIPEVDKQILPDGPEQRKLKPVRQSEDRQEQ